MGRRSRDRQLRPALAAYVRDLLSHGTPYEMLPFAPAADVLAGGHRLDVNRLPGSIESSTAALGRVPCRRAVCPAPAGTGRRCGTSLRRADWARPCLVTCAASSTSTSPGSAEGSSAHVLQAVARALPLLRALACPRRSYSRPQPHSYPVRLQPRFCSAPAAQPGCPWRSSQARCVRLRFYLRRDVDVDASTLYRLFHQGLADQLRADARCRC